MSTRRALIDLNDGLIDQVEPIIARAEKRQSTKLTRSENETLELVVSTCETLGRIIDELPLTKYPTATQLHQLYLRGGSPGALIKAIDRENGIR
jgi:hypothetical protein